jgi:two-component system OmpR family sensor kinase
MKTSTRLFWPWLALAVVCCLLMWRSPGEETVPYHVAYIGVAAAYGLEPWPRTRAVWSIAAYALISGAILIERAAAGAIGWQETAEIPLMATLMLLMVWHVRRRHDALASLTEMSDRELERAAQRERLSRMTSHEMRTPATIATGYVELLLAGERDPERRADLAVVLDEIERIVLSSDRLLRMLWIPEQDNMDVLDIDHLLQDVVERWRVVADRDWQVDTTSGTQLVSASRLRACLDTLVENSLRYTEVGDVVRLVSYLRGGFLVVGVADSGPGLDPALAEEVNAGLESDSAAQRAEFADPKAKTGLGLGLVREAIASRKGRVVAGRSPEGGALVLMVSPLDDRRQPTINREQALGVAADAAVHPVGQ